MDDAYGRAERAPVNRVARAEQGDRRQAHDAGQVGRAAVVADVASRVGHLVEQFDVVARADEVGDALDVAQVIGRG